MTQSQIDSWAISIHALTRRATKLAEVLNIPVKISIHALTRRATSCSIPAAGISAFQSTPSRGGRQQTVTKTICRNACLLGNISTNMHIIGKEEKTPACFHLFCPYFLVRTSPYFYVHIGFASRRSVVHLLVCHVRLRNVPPYSYSDFLRNKNEHCLSLDSFLLIHDA